MASKREARLGTVHAMLMDTMGNLGTGNDERALRYLNYAVSALRKHIEIESTHNSKAEREFDELNLATAKASESEVWPKFRVNDAKFEKYLSLGLMELMPIINGPEG